MVKTILDKHYTMPKITEEKLKAIDNRKKPTFQKLFGKSLVELLEEQQQEIIKNGDS